MVSAAHGMHIIGYLFKWKDRGLLRTVLFSASILLKTATP